MSNFLQPVRFAVHGKGSLPGIKIDWDARVELGADTLAAMASHHLEGARVGVLQRGFTVGGVTYERGALAVRIAVGHEIYLQTPDEPEDTEASPPPATSSSVTVTQDATGSHHRVIVGAAYEGERVDLILVALLPALSRARVQRLIELGHVAVAGQPIRKANQRMRTGDTLTIEIADAT